MLDAYALSTCCCQLITQGCHFRGTSHKRICELLGLLRSALAGIDSSNGCHRQITFGNGSDVIRRSGGREPEASNVMVDAVVVLDCDAKGCAVWHQERLGQAEDHCVRLACFWQNRPSKVWERGIIVDGVEGTPALPRNVIPCKQQLLKACRRMAEFDGSSKRAIRENNLPFYFRDDKVAVWCAPGATLRKGWIWKRFNANTGDAGLHGQINGKAALDVIRSAGKDGIVWTNGQHCVAICSDLGRFRRCPAVCYNILCNRYLETSQVMVIAMGLLQS